MPMYNRSGLILATAVFASILFSCRRNDPAAGLSPISRMALEDTSSVYYGHFDRYPEDIHSLPIGIFDAGTDGLLALEKFLCIDRFDNITGKEVPDGIADFAGENFQYLADFASSGDNLPGSAVKDALFLMGKEYYNLPSDEFRSGVKEPVKAIIMLSDVACMAAGDEIETLTSLSGTGVRVVNTLMAGINASLEGMKGRDSYCIGIMSSPGSLSSNVYESIVREAARKDGFSGVVQVFNQRCEGLGEAMEKQPGYVCDTVYSPRESYAGPVLGMDYNNIDITLMSRYNFDTSGNALLSESSHGRYVSLQLNSIENYVRYHLVSLVERHRRSGSRIPLSCIVLEDPSYISLKDIFYKVIRELYDFRRDGVYLYRNSISGDFRFIDPIECAAEECYRILREEGALAFSVTPSELSAFAGIYVPNAAQDSAGFTKAVPFSPRYASPESFGIVLKEAPLTYSLLSNILY